MVEAQIQRMEEERYNLLILFLNYKNVNQILFAKTAVCIFLTFSVHRKRMQQQFLEMQNEQNKKLSELQAQIKVIAFDTTLTNNANHFFFFFWRVFTKENNGMHECCSHVMVKIHHSIFFACLEISNKFRTSLFFICILLILLVFVDGGPTLWRYCCRWSY